MQRMALYDTIKKLINQRTEKMAFFKLEDLKPEAKIVWLKDMSQYPWVREGMTDFTSKQGISKSRQAQIGPELVGYAELEEDAPPGFIDPATGRKHYYRRIFMLRDGDYKNYNDGTYPSEAVEPETVEPKVKGLSPGKKAQIAVRIPRSLLQKLNRHIQIMEMSQTEVVVSALSKYLDSQEDIPLIERIVKIEERLAQLEGQ
ncbi:DUF6009 family protein [Capilliphycus salinus ALCB114379]|uniref:DUF6009 family protein n=1 Tax=Capilliphycus salinus TaxID=2768948 RepID=UPI0039A6D0EC